MATVDYFLKMDGVYGETADSTHKDAMDIMSWSGGVQQTGTAGSGGGAGGGRAQFKDISLIKQMDKSSPKLLLLAATGEHIKRATIICRKAGKTPQEYLKVTLSDAILSSYSVGGGGSPIATESLSIAYSKIEYEYKPQKADGSLDAPVKTGYDVAARKKL